MNLRCCGPRSNSFFGLKKTPSYCETLRAKHLCLRYFPRCSKPHVQNAIILECNNGVGKRTLQVTRFAIMLSNWMLRVKFKQLVICYAGCFNVNVFEAQCMISCDYRLTIALYSWLIFIIIYIIYCWTLYLYTKYCWLMVTIVSKRRRLSWNAIRNCSKWEIIQLLCWLVGWIKLTDANKQQKQIRGSSIDWFGFIVYVNTVRESQWRTEP